ncbi:haloacid dehalogenase type II [Vineibacter terrae]|uniref:(S)-2-haloacid dehalogenase n=1 Tax=Vineibacter terrae TaxID=2586908 RepID=A0A5C8PTP8_9HYPH|nr:haloacid dehalogenase type II [Vineibacter terrae]TXL80287.1 haloacid dehalogenase type II [Vineibacter terrae]
MTLDAHAIDAAGPRRRHLLQLTGSGLAAGLFASSARAQADGGSVKAVAFDAFVTFDPRPVFARAEQLFPGKGAELSNLWRIRQFEYTWLRVVSQRYADFWTVTEDALRFAAAAAKVDLTADKRDELMGGFLALKAHPDVLPGLQALRGAGIRLAFLSNMTERMLQAAIHSAGLEGLFEHVLSTDTLRTYKPDPRAYQMAIDAFGLRREEIVFAAFGGWDAAGARSFGYRTFWANRLKLPAEGLDAKPDAIGDTLADLVTFVGRT